MAPYARHPSGHGTPTRVKPAFRYRSFTYSLAIRDTCVTARAPSVSLAKYCLSICSAMPCTDMAQGTWAQSSFKLHYRRGGYSVSDKF